MTNKLRENASAEKVEYNTSRDHLIIPEYGRHVQKMIEHAIALKDQEERNKAARSVVLIMAQMNPHLRDVNDYLHKLWDHLFIISDFKLDVDSPYPKPNPESLNVRPNKLAYPNKKIRFKHYGNSVQLMIEEALKMEEGDKKSAFIMLIANHMKKSYLSWNRDSVNDEVIWGHLATLSDDQLKAPKEGVELTATNEILAKTAKKPSNRNHKRKGGKKPQGRKRR